jgi:hypothetical protein
MTSLTQEQDCRQDDNMKQGSNNKFLHCSLSCIAAPVGAELVSVREIQRYIFRSNQRVLNDIQRARLPCGRMIGFLAHPRQ